MEPFVSAMAIGYIVTSMVVLTIMTRTGWSVIPTIVWVGQFVGLPFVSGLAIFIIDDQKAPANFTGILAGVLIAFIQQKRHEMTWQQPVFVVTGDNNQADEATTESTSG